MLRPQPSYVFASGDGTFVDVFPQCSQSIDFLYIHVNHHLLLLIYPCRLSFAFPPFPFVSTLLTAADQILFVHEKLLLAAVDRLIHEEHPPLPLYLLLLLLLLLSKSKEAAGGGRERKERGDHLQKLRGSHRPLECTGWWLGQILSGKGKKTCEISSSATLLFSMDLKPFLLLLLAALVSVDASVHVYSREAFKEVGNAFLLSGGSEGIVASRSGHAGPSYIRFENITFWRSKEAAEQHSSMEHSTGLIQAVIFEAADRNNIGGSAYGGQKSICCTPDLAKLEGCKQGEILRRPSSEDFNWPFLINTQFSGTLLSTKMEQVDVSITKTGMYNLFFISCDPNLRGLLMSGKTLWRNPSGYLPGRMAPLMTFYLVMALAYFILCGIWFSQYAKYWRDILQLQNYISLIIVLGLFEMTLWYFEYLNFNDTGMRPVGITTWVVTVGAIRKTISRLLILSVSMGYGVVRPTLGGLTSKVLLLGFAYFLATESLDIAENVGTINDISGKARLFLVFPDALLDAFLILWIFTSLSRTLEKLQARRSYVKLEIYRKFTNALAVSVIASVAWIGYEVYFKATDPFSERWQSAWIITAFWDILAFALLCVMCYLWAPSQSSRRYAYSEEIGEDAEGEEAQSLAKWSSEGDIGLASTDRKERSNAFDVEEDGEEDKRE